MKIKNVHIKYFRSIYNQKIDLGDLNVFVGLNDTGKSNVLKALNLFFKNETGWKEIFNFRSDFNHKRKKEFEQPDRLKEAREIAITINFQEEGGVQPVWQKKWRSNGTVLETRYDKNTPKSKRNPITGFQPYSKIPSKLNKITYYYIPALKGPDYISFLVGQLSNVLSDRASGDIRIAAEGFETNLSEHLSDLTDLIQTELDLTSLLKLPLNLVGIFENMEFSDDRGIGLSHRGDGMRTRHIPILLSKIAQLHTLLKDKGELFDHFIWGYEEPENNVEMAACYKMAKLFWENYAPKHQILLTTHSPAFYGLPERVVDDWVQSKDGIYRYYVEQDDQDSVYLDVKQEELNPHFILPAISPFLEDWLKEKAKLQEELQDLQNRPGYFDTPTIIVEGITDKMILEKTISLFSPQVSGCVKFEYPENAEEGGGANFVKDHLVLWEHKQKHIKKENRKRAIGLFDDDEAGNSARKDYGEIVSSPKMTHVMTYKFKLPAGSHIMQLKHSDLEYELTRELENLYSPDFWDRAEEGDWLEASNCVLAGPIQGDILSNIFIQTVEESTLEYPLKRYVLRKFRHHSKVAAAEAIAGSTEEQARGYLYLFEGIMKSALKKIGIEVDQQFADANPVE